MSAPAARNCLLAVLLTATVACGDRTLADTPASTASDEPATLRCEPGPDFSAPTAPAAAANSTAAFAAIDPDRIMERTAFAAPRAARPSTRAGRPTAHALVFLRSTPRSSVYLGLNRRGVAGVHFLQHTATSPAGGEYTAHRDGG